MAGGDGWWATPFPPPPLTGISPPMTLSGGFGVNGGGEEGPFGALAFSFASSSFSSSARSVYPDPAGAAVGKVSFGMKSDGNALEGEGAGEIVDAEIGFGGGACSAGDWKMPLPLPPQQRQQKQVPSPVRNGKSIAERRAARCGFTAPRINTAKFRCSGSPICSPAAVRSPCLTIPPGLSPTALLDSPVMLMNAQAQPSPTTGSFALSPRNHEMLGTIPLKGHMEEGNSGVNDSCFTFKLPQDPVSMSCIQSAENKVQMQMEYESHAGFLGEILQKRYAGDSQSDNEASDDTVARAKNTTISSSDPRIISDETELEQPRTQHLQDGDQAGTLPPLCVGRPSEDGFNWRKYGQKQVKGSEYPRSYYKCTHPSCQVKKKVERSYDGQITEIIYKGKHNHPKPQPARRSIIGSSFPVNEIPEPPDNGRSSSMRTEGESVWSTLHGSEEDIGCGNCPTDGLERISSTSAITDLSVSDPSSTAIDKHLSELESTDNLDLSSTMACHDDDDQATQESMSLEGDDEDDKAGSKRRKSENYLIESGSASRAVREPRVVVQTESEVDILDDGYRWRKYGQKVVKGNPNPRSYYKCTNPGCSVRKHVERAAHDLKSVITTYEGKHNHEVPVARNSGHSSSSGGSFPLASITQSALPGSAINTENNANGRDLAPHFKRKLDLSNEYTKPSCPGNLHGDTKFGASPPFEVKLLHQLAFHPRGHSINHAELLQASATANLSPEFPISFPMSVHRSSNAAKVGFDVDHRRATGTALESLLGQQPEEAGVRFLKAPKQEENDDAFGSAVLPTSNFANASPSLCGHMMGGYPLQ